MVLTYVIIKFKIYLEKYFTFLISYVIFNYYGVINIMTLTYGRGYVYSIQYHIVWCLKYRRKILSGQIEKDLFEILNNIAKDNGFEILECNGDLDHVHLLVNCNPQIYIPNMLKALKGVSAHPFMKKYKEQLKKKLLEEHLWNPSYYVATVSENTQDQIRQYIQNQKIK